MHVYLVNPDKIKTIASRFESKKLKNFLGNSLAFSIFQGLTDKDEK